MPQGGAREGHLSPRVTPWGLGGCPWRSAGSSGGGRGGRLPRGHHLFPRQLLPLEVLGSVWKAVLRELEERVGDWAYFWVGQDRQHPLRTTQGPAGSMASWGTQSRGAWGSSQHSSHSGLGSWRRGVRGSKREPGTFWHLGKADPQGHPAPVVLHLGRQLRYQDCVLGDREETPRGHPGE